MTAPHSRPRPRSHRRSPIGPLLPRRLRRLPRRLRRLCCPLRLLLVLLLIIQHLVRVVALLPSPPRSRG